MAFVLGSNSLARLATVEKKLQDVVKLAISISEVDFTVVQGNRTQDEQDRLYGQGRTADQLKKVGINPAYAKPSMAQVTWTRNSNHIGGRAVDLAPYVNGKIDWNDRSPNWDKIAKAMKTAAERLGVKIGWGGDWKKTIDKPHFELL